MSTQIRGLLEAWYAATGNAKWGVQKVFHDVLTLASQEKTTLIYGADYREGHPCLVNTVGAMLTSHIEVPLGGGQGVPTDSFGEIVRLFNQINGELYTAGYNTKQGYVSPLAAEILLRNFAKFPHAFDITPQTVNVDDAPYFEISDEQIAKEMVSLFLLPNMENSQHLCTQNNELHAIIPATPRDRS